MAIKKATVDSTMAKVEAAKETKATAPAKAEEKKAPAKKAPAKKAAAAKTEEKKAAPAKAEEKKAAPAKKAAAKAPAKKTTTTEKVVIEYAGGQVVTSDIVAKAIEVSGKKSIKELNVYYQPETNMVYFTADGEEGSFSL